MNGLYDPRWEHDGCGVACIARLDCEMLLNPGEVEIAKRGGMLRSIGNDAESIVWHERLPLAHRRSVHEGIAPIRVVTHLVVIHE